MICSPLSVRHDAIEMTAILLLLMLMMMMMMIIKGVRVKALWPLCPILPYDNIYFKGVFPPTASARKRVVVEITRLFNFILSLAHQENQADGGY